MKIKLKPKKASMGKLCIRRSTACSATEVIGFPFSTPEGWFALDTETTGLDPWGTYGIDREFHPARPFAVSLCSADGNEGYIRWHVDPHTRQVNIDPKSRSLLQGLLSRSDLTLVGYNLPFDRRMLEMAGFQVRCKCVDVLIGMHVLDPTEFSFQLKHIASKYLDIPRDDQKELEKSAQSARLKCANARKKALKALADEGIIYKPRTTYVRQGQKASSRMAEARRGRMNSRLWMACKAKKLVDGQVYDLATTATEQDYQADYWMADPALCRKYAITDAVRTAMLYIMVMQELRDDRHSGGKLYTVWDREHQVMEEIRLMESRGVRVDAERVSELRTFYENYIEKSNRIIDEETDGGFNPSSDRDLRTEFFGKRKYKPIRYNIPKGADSPTDCQDCQQDVLDADGNPMREWKKAKKSGKERLVKVKHSPGCPNCQSTGKSPKCDGEFLEHVGVGREQDAAGEEVLVEKDRLAYWLLHHSAASQMLSTAINPYHELKVCDDAGGWVLHPNFKQVEAKTGRIQAERPNLMGVASDESGNKRSNVPYRPRESFVPRPGFWWYVPDYSQIEVWAFAHVAKDAKMKEMLYTGRDCHGEIAKGVWGSEWDDEVAEEYGNLPPENIPKSAIVHVKAKKRYRKMSKIVMFLKLYGGGVGKLSQALRCSVDEAKRFQAQWEAAYPGAKRFMTETVHQAKHDGFVINPFGRRYPIDRNFAYRAVNYLVQGSAAEIFKNSIIRLGELSREKYPEKMFLELLIHDEFAIEVHESAVGPESMLDVVQAMQGDDHVILGSRKPFPVGMKVASSRWSSVQEVENIETWRKI